MPYSLLLEGILAEDAEAARVQVWSFDHATVSSEVVRRVSRLAGWISEKLPRAGRSIRGVLSGIPEAVPSDPTRHARDDDLILPIQPDHWRGAKLSRILNHFDLRFGSSPSEGELLDLCLQAEGRAVDLLKRMAGAGRTAEAIPPFDGASVADLSRYVIRRTFEELDASFSIKSQSEQERIAVDIARRLAELPPELRERIRADAGIADLSAAALKRTGAIAAVGGALLGTVGMAGFAAYTTLTSVIATAAGFVGLTLPFAVYVYATSALALLSTPVVLAAATLVGGRFAISRANRQMRDRLVPMMIATAVLASTADTPARSITYLVNELMRHSSMLQSADRKLGGQIRNTFPCLSRFA